MSNEPKSDTETDRRLKKIQNKGLEPGIINNDMLQRLIAEQGPTGEAARLCRNNPIDYKTITVLRLDYQNLLKIDYLWVLTNLEQLSLKCNKLKKIEHLEKLINLRELDLSFNCIERIENLDCLQKLEFLSLFRNRIRKLENLDGLGNLVRLSVGHNLIDTFDGIERLRFMKKLYTLNLEANPISVGEEKGVPFRIYVAAFLPNLKYYNYIVLSDEEREQGCRHFRSELRMLEEKEKDEINRIEEGVERETKEAFLVQCFVEKLNDENIFHLIFTNDENNDVFMKIETICDRTTTDLRNKMLAIAQEICQVAASKHASRTSEINEFNDALETAKRQTQMDSIRLVQEYQDNRIELISTLKNTFRRIIVERESENPQKIKQMIEDINRLDEKFNAMTEKIWYNVMESELSLHERIDERIRSFSQVIKEMVKEFAENLQLLFMNLRNVCNEYFGKLQESAMNYLKHGQHRDNLPEELKKILCSGVGIKNFFSQNHNHLKENFQNRIDSLTKKLNSWETDLIADQHKTELERNRRRIFEFNIFLDGQRSIYTNAKETFIKESKLCDYFK